MLSSRSRSTRLPPSSRTYPYRAVGGGPLKPAVKVVLQGSGARIPVWGIVDSGADYTFLPRAYSGPLGIDLADCEQELCDTAGGTTTQYIWVAGIDALVQGINVTVHLKTAFADTPHVLLGREDFFAEFIVTFDERAQQFSLDRYQ